MKKNVSLVVSGAGWIGGLVDRLIKALRERGVSDEAIHSLVVDGGELPIGKIADALAEVIRQVKNIFCLVVGQHKTTEDAIKAGKYDWSNNSINSLNFPMRSQSAGKRMVELIEFDHNPTSEEVFVEAEKRGLERPVYEDAFNFGEQFPDKQRERPIVFLHEPWQNPYGDGRVIVLSGLSSERSLNLDYFDGRWDRGCVFAFVRK